MPKRRVYHVSDWPGSCPAYLHVSNYRHAKAANVNYDDYLESEGLIRLYDLTKDFGVAHPVLLEILRQAKVPRKKAGTALVVDEALAIAAIQEFNLSDTELRWEDFYPYIRASPHTIRKYVRNGILKPVRKLGNIPIYTVAQAIEIEHRILADQKEKKDKQKSERKAYKSIVYTARDTFTSQYNEPPRFTQPRVIYDRRRSPNAQA